MLVPIFLIFSILSNTLLKNIFALSYHNQVYYYRIKSSVRCVFFTEEQKKNSNSIQTGSSSLPIEGHDVWNCFIALDDLISNIQHSIATPNFRDFFHSWCIRTLVSILTTYMNLSSWKKSTILGNLRLITW